MANCTRGGNYEEKPPRPPTPQWKGEDPEQSWRQCNMELAHRMGNVDIPRKNKQGVLLRRALTGTARLLVEYSAIEDLTRGDAAAALTLKRPHGNKDYVSTYQDQADSESATYGLH